MQAHASPDDPLPLYHAVKAVMQPLVRVLLRPTVEGVDYVPARGPAILCANHLSLIDPILVPVLIPRPVVYLAKAEMFAWAPSQWLFTHLGVVPVDRAGGSAARSSLERGTAVLQDGGVLSMFPEGTRSPDGRLYRGKTGPVRLAVRTGAPIVPIGLVGTRDVMPPHSFLPRFGHSVTVRIGRPFTVPAGEASVDLRAETDRMMRVVQALSGQEYVDAYARHPRQARYGGAPDERRRGGAVTESDRSQGL